MTLQTFSVFLYTRNNYKDYTYGIEDSCEAVCRELCKELQISPVSTTLFSLRIKGTTNYLPSCRRVLSNVKYEFRVRYQMSSLSELKLIDKLAYNYYYHQVRWDLVNNMIPELEYPNYKEKVVGLAVTNMYIEMLEHQVTPDYLIRNYRNYIAPKFHEKHFYILKKKISNELSHIRNMDHDSYYVKSTYLKTINTFAPNYLVEKYSAQVPYLIEENFVHNGLCPVEIEFSPFHDERPGLSVYYTYKNKWVHLAKIEDIYTIINEGNDSVKLEIRDHPRGFSIKMSDQNKMESFISLLSGYYRLMVKWTVDLCPSLPSSHLKTLNMLKCHGPIGGEYSYMKLKDRGLIPGAYIIRQCDKEYDIYYIDMVVKIGKIDTLKIEHFYSEWRLHYIFGQIRTFNNLPDLARSITTDSEKKIRLPPAESDKSTKLLLCVPINQLKVKQKISEHTEIELRKKPAQLINPAKELRKYLNSKRSTENGVITEMRADWILPDEKKLEVTLKILEDERYCRNMMHLTEKWSPLISPELIKIYGFTLSSPYTLVTESTIWGPLDKFLQSHRAFNTIALIDAAYSLARALHYLQENNIVHGKIRCGTLQVIDFEESKQLTIRLGDPGLQESYTEDDLPWIPYEYHKNLERAKIDYKTDIWAYATTLWQIFSRGRVPTAKEYKLWKLLLPHPMNCPRDVYDLMVESWDAVPDRRVAPQMIFAKLTGAKAVASHTYATINTHVIEDTSTMLSNGSVISTRTDDTLVTSHSDLDYTERMSNGSGTTILSDPFIYETEDLPHQTHESHAQNGKIILSNINFAPLSGVENSDGIIETDEGGRLILQGKIGQGHYGVVFKGQYEYEDNSTVVAIKRLNATPSRRALRDFEREIKIMKSLEHPNIVKIITWMDAPEVMIVMEYMRHYSFSIYLSAHSPSLTIKRLLRFAKDIASGMNYLKGKSIIHRDLAARNILVESDECVKISDFGLAQVADSNGYYLLQNIRDFPINWYAPESIKHQKFSFASDVWSFGVTLFEMFSRGKEPYLKPRPADDENPQIDLINKLERGVRLELEPNLCPKEIYDELLMPCWHQDAHLRPDFSHILRTIDKFLNECGEDV